MSQSVDHTTATASSAAADATIDPITTIDLQIISPSVGVTGPISLPQLPTTTTVRQLKEKIREALAVRPAIESQRLIHSGRMLSRESEALSEIFGRDTNRSSGPRTLHLVLRPSASESVPQTTAPSTANITAQQPQAHQGIGLPHLPNLATTNPQDAEEQFAASRATMQETMQRIQRNLDQMRAGRGQLDAAGIPNSSQPFGTPQGPTGPRAGTPTPIFGARPGSPQQIHVPEFPHLPGMNPPQLPLPTLQNLLAQQQQQRAALGLHGVQHGNPQIPGMRGMPTIPDFAQMPRFGGSNQQGVGPTRTYSQEGVGPNGDRWRINVTESVVPVFNNQQPNQHPNQHPNQQPNQHANQVLSNGIPGATPTFPSQNQPERSSSAPPPMNSRPNIPATSNSFSTASPIQNSQTAINNNASSSNSGPMVYILSSPTGPRALLVSDNGEQFYTRPISATIQAGVPTTLATTFPELRNRPHRPHRHRRPRNANGAANDAAAIPQLHPHNPAAAGIFRGLVGPHLWLIVRLLVFVWFFIAPNSSWWRIITIWGIALIIFCANTGVFGGAADTVFGPLRRHLQRLVPLHGPEQPIDPAVRGQDHPLAPEGGRPGELDPARVAARLVEQHRLENANWFMTQLRRVEHGAVLFLASLVPGIGERHIAAREAEANIAAVAEAERLRQEEVAANPVVEGVEENNDVGQSANTSAVVEGGTQPGPEGQRAADEDAQERGVDRAQVQPLVEV